MTSSKITTPDIGGLLAPFLPALPAATVSTEPAIGVLPLLSPILRQRVQLLSAASTEPWLRLLCYDTAKAVRLGEIVRSGRLEPHPVSGEVEVDWDYDAKTRYRRLDPETFQSLVVVEHLELTFQLVYCVGDAEGGGDGWRVGEVSVADKSTPFGSFGGYSTVLEAEKGFEDKNLTKTVGEVDDNSIGGGLDAFEEEDDSYWDQYDGTPARTPARSPAVKRSPAPQSTQTSQVGTYRSASAEDAYYAQYDSVQPALDNDDPDGKAEHIEVAPPLGLGTIDRSEQNELNETNGAWTLAEPERSPSPPDADKAAALLHPRPASSASSNGSQTVAKLEETAGRQEQNEFGVKQHVSRSIRSLYLLSRASGIDREEFERLVKTELDVLALIQDQD